MDGTGSTGHAPYARVTVAEAAAVLGVNVVTVRRMIKRGQLEAERVHRPQGSAYLVTLPGHGAGDETLTGQSAQDMSCTQGTPTPAADAMVSLIQTTIATVLGPLVAELAASRQTNERQSERVAELERENGRQGAELERAASIAVKLSDELEAARAQISTLAARTEAQSAATAPAVPLTPLSQLLALWRWFVLVLVVAITTMTVLLAWPN